MLRIVEAVVIFAIRRPWLTIGVAAALTALGLFVTVTRFAINTDTARLIAPDVQWRKDEIAFEKAFPQGVDLIVAVLDAATPEMADEAADKLVAALASRSVFKSVRRPDAGPFFDRNGLLFLSVEDLTKTLAQLSEQQEFLAPMAADPSLRGIMRALSGMLQALDMGASLSDFTPPLRAFNEAFVDVLAGKPARVSWQRVLGGQEPGAHERRKLVLIQPNLDFGALQPGQAATDLIRYTASELGLVPQRGVTMRLTGPVPLADEEFITVTENMALNLGLTVAIIAFLLFLALRFGKIIGAVLATLMVGLVVTSGVGLLAVGQLNLISVAFAALFIGLGVDFGIQFSVRYRAERHALGELAASLEGAARGVGGALTLAAVSLLAGFFSFLPTDFRGVSELGLIAGLGMVIAYLATLTVLPALLTVLKPPAEAAPIETMPLAAVDHWIARHRRFVLIATAVVVLAGAPLLLGLSFDGNPMNLRNSKVESVATFLDLARDSDTAPNTIEVVVKSFDEIAPLAEKLAALPEVARVVSLSNFIPADQKDKLAIIRAAASELRRIVKPARLAPAPSDEENVTALRDAVAALRNATARQTTDVARQLTETLDALAGAPADKRAAAEGAATVDLKRMLERLRLAMTADRVTRDTLPADLVAQWVAPDGHARLEVFPKGNANDNAVIARFAGAVRTVAPQATGAPVTIVEAGRTVVTAFAEAGLFAAVTIFIILAVALRNPVDVALTLGPLVLAGIMTLETATLINLPLNFANIIALPLMFGVGVAFHIYYVVAWRAGVGDMLASSLTRAIFFSALTTGTAFGSLCLSSHPGTASMGQLLALSLFFTLLAAFIIVPAFLGPPRLKETERRGAEDLS